MTHLALKPIFVFGLFVVLVGLFVLSASISGYGNGLNYGFGPGGCCGAGDGPSEDEIEEQASDYYITKTGETDFTVSVEDYGCHQEASIIKDGETVMKLSIRDGRVSEI
jgi:hypothetical protein